MVSDWFQVYLGGHNIAKDYTELRRVKRIVDHEDFDIFTFNNDIALLELDKPLRYGPTIQPACLPDGSKHFFVYSVRPSVAQFQNVSNCR